MLWGIYSAIYGEVNISVEKCVEVKGDYVEKQQSGFISVTLKSWSGRKILDPPMYKVSTIITENTPKDIILLLQYIILFKDVIVILITI